MPTSGDVQEITVSHPQGPSVVLFPMAGEEFTFDPGGLRNNDDDNMIDGGGRAVNQKNRRGASIEGPVSWDMNDTDELSALKEIAALPGEAEVTVSHVNGAQWSGKLQFRGDIQGNMNTGQISIKMGGSELEKV